MKKRTLQEMNEQYKSCPTTQREYVVDGNKFIVVSHYIGNKDIDETLQNYAMNKALNETLGLSAVQNINAD